MPFAFVMIQSPLTRFLALYGALFAAIGVASPFLPGLLLQEGLRPATLGVVLAAGAAVRLLAGPLGGRLADRSGRPVAVLAGCTAAAAIVALGYAPARGLPLLLLVSVSHAAVLAPLTPIADALALGSSRAPGSLQAPGSSRAPGSSQAPDSSQNRRGFEYGWVRAAGSAAFILGTLLSGQAVGWAGLGIIVWLNAGLLAVAAGCACIVPDRLAGTRSAGETRIAGRMQPSRSIRTLFDIPVFARLMAIVALVGGSHALHDGFEVIRWRSAGLSTGQCSLLWAISVASELLVFLFLGQRLLHRLGLARALTLSALAGIVRWGTAAQTAWFPAMALVEPLHGLTFALLHLACMDSIGRAVPSKLAATAQAFYGTIALGATTAAVTLASGPLYGQLGAGAFWAMAALCALALPLTAGIRQPPDEPATP